MKYQGSQGYRNNNNNVYISIPMKRSDNDLKKKILKIIQKTNFSKYITKY